MLMLSSRKDDVLLGHNVSIVVFLCLLESLCCSFLFFLSQIESEERKVLERKRQNDEVPWKCSLSLSTFRRKSRPIDWSFQMYSSCSTSYIPLWILLSGFRVEYISSIIQEHTFSSRLLDPVTKVFFFLSFLFVKSEEKREKRRRREELTFGKRDKRRRGKNMRRNHVRHEAWWWWTLIPFNEKMKRREGPLYFLSPSFLYDVLRGTGGRDSRLFATSLFLLFKWWEEERRIVKIAVKIISWFTDHVNFS